MKKIYFFEQNELDVHVDVSQHMFDMKNGSGNHVKVCSHVRFKDAIVRLNFVNMGLSPRRINKKSFYFIALKWDWAAKSDDEIERVNAPLSKKVE